MERRYLFAAILSLAILTFCFSYLDMVQSFSSRYMIWDSIEHVLGGVTVGFFTLFALTLFRLHPTGPLTVFAVLAVGIAWEIMEAHYGIGGSQWMGYWADTIKDVVCDVVGGYGAVVIGRRLRHL